ncbi:MAG TPA: indole-3-glycerol-phosphate synthase, partial [Cytophagaceae bacterium]|nr:indole-3-glycerol-phosphate synthase [Cytophagaceae bacterium]
STPTISLKKFLLDETKSGIIAEHKRKSPSKGIINDQLTVEEIVKGYASAGASAVSVLTDNPSFGGSDEDLIKARAVIDLPILRKDFIVDEFQIIEARSIGANIILLIAACLTPEEINRLADFAKSLGMEVLLEVHSEAELKPNCFDSIDCIGVNNRNLKDFSVQVSLSKELASKIPDRFLKISESGIDSFETILDLKEYGYKGFLIGENFMKTSNPGASMKLFVEKLKMGKVK